MTEKSALSSTDWPRPRRRPQSEAQACDQAGRPVALQSGDQRRRHSGALGAVRHRRTGHHRGGYGLDRLRCRQTGRHHAGTHHRSRPLDALVWLTVATTTATSISTGHHPNTATTSNASCMPITSSSIPVSSAGLLRCFSVAHPRLVWASFGSWLRTLQPGIPPCELVVATALASGFLNCPLGIPGEEPRLHESLAEQADTNKMQGFQLAA